MHWSKTVLVGREWKEGIRKEDREVSEWLSEIYCSWHIQFPSFISLLLLWYVHSLSLPSPVHCIAHLDPFLVLFLPPLKWMKKYTHTHIHEARKRHISSSSQWLAVSTECASPEQMEQRIERKEREREKERRPLSVVTHSSLPLSPTRCVLSSSASDNFYPPSCNVDTHERGSRRVVLV